VAISRFERTLEHRQSHDERYLSSQDESPDDHRTPEPSDDDGSKSSNSRDGEIDEENYHVDTSKVPRKKRKVGVVQKNFRAEKPSHSAKPFRKACDTLTTSR
jgi:hypothetical protein